MDGGADARLLLVRHGRTQSNVDGRRLGRADVPLDDVGRAQAAQLADTLSTTRIDAVYASPLARARDTALAVAGRHGLEVRLDDDLLEFDYGRFEGSSRAETKVRLRREHLTTPVDGGESLHDVWLRAERFLRRIGPETAAGGQLLVVGHRRTNRMIVGALHGFTLAETAAADHYRPEPGQLVGYDVVAAGSTVRLADAAR